MIRAIGLLVLLVSAAPAGAAGDIQFKRGPESRLPASASVCEPVCTTDTNRLFLGTGDGIVPVTPQRCVDYFDGRDGVDGRDGIDGAPGAGVPIGGAAGQQLRKKSSADFDTEWFNPSDTVTWGNIVGEILNQLDLKAVLDNKEPRDPNIQGHIGNTNNPHLTTAGQVGAEPALGVPASDNQCLRSSSAGVRSWGDCGTGGESVPSITYSAGTTYITGPVVIK